MNYKKTQIFGLIGNPLKHSFSKKYFTQKFKKEKLSGFLYRLFPIEKANYFPFLKIINSNLKGLNVTIPYKEEVIPFLDELSEEAREIGAVNCINFFDGKMKGYNTDAYGFEVSLMNFLNNNSSNDFQITSDFRALILGTGGASKAVKYVLKKNEIGFKTVSRNRTRGDLIYEDLDEKLMQEYRLIINTTPVGTFPKTKECPRIPYEYLKTGYFLYDLVYNPEETLFLHLGKKKGANVANGLEMLHLQAEKSWEIWKK